MARVHDLFSSIRLGIVLLILLFIYSWVGSAGFWLPGHLPATANHAWMHDIYWIIPWTQLHVRQSPWIEQTEFEWFHWWPFLVLMGLLCVNLTVTTLRRIPFKPVNYGVWMIHAGVILLTLTCVWYFGVKVEGDILLPRKRLTITLANGEHASMNCKVGGSVTLGEGDNQYTCTVQSIDPRWELLSGEDKGARAYSATLNIERGDETFMRQVLVGYPEYTEDIVRSNDPSQPFTRLKNLTGERIGDDNIAIAFDDEVRDTFYLRETPALYVREVGETQWRERPISGLPRYHDYVSDTDNVWPTPDPTVQWEALSITPQNDPNAGDDLPLATITDVLQYAVPEQNFIDVPGAERLNPAAVVRLEAAGQSAEYQLFAFDPTRSNAENGRLAFRWLRDEADLTPMMQPPMLHITIEDAAFEVAHNLTDLNTEKIALGDTGYFYRVESIENNLALDAQRTFSVVSVIITRPDGEEFRRWVFDDPALNRDMPADEVAADPEQRVFMDERVAMRYEPGGAPGIVTLLAGPDRNQLRLLLSLPRQEARIEPINLHQPVALDQGVSLTVHRYASGAVFSTRPFIVPRSQRNRDVGQQLAMIGVTIPGAAPQKTYWLPFHLYPFTSDDQSMRRFPYRPARVLLEDGREIELLFSRKSHPLPYDVALDDFRVIEHIGGFTGATNSVRDWNSVLRFREDQQASWSETSAVAMNKPVARGEWSFFQAQWDPPDPPNSAGLNYTVLGVGNRHGVNAMLASSTLIVIGLIYAFYVKPLIRRRQQRDALTAATAAGNAKQAAGAAPEQPADDRPAERELASVASSDTPEEQPS